MINVLFLFQLWPSVSTFINKTVGEMGWKGCQEESKLFFFIDEDTRSHLNFLLLVGLSVLSTRRCDYKTDWPLSLIDHSSGVFLLNIHLAGPRHLPLAS